MSDARTLLDETCSGCSNGRTFRRLAEQGGAGLIFTREMKPGVKGGMGQSFARSYFLCYPCLEFCRGVGAVIRYQTHYADGTLMTRPRATVAAKTLQFLQGHTPMSERTAEQIVKERWPDAVCYISADWRGYVVMKEPGNSRIGNLLTRGSFSNQNAAWADAARRVEEE